MPSNIEEDYLNIHNEMADANGLNSKALWGSKESQERRFEVLEKVFLSKSDFSVIDYGCGLGHFYEYLIKKGYSNIKYIGVELNERFVEETKNRLPNVQIELGSSKKVESLLESGVDYLVSSGIYNLGESEELVQSLFIIDYSKFFDLIKMGLAANFLSRMSNKKDEKSIYHNPYSLLKQCEERISKNIVYFHNYLPHDFTIFLYK